MAGCDRAVELLTLRGIDNLGDHIFRYDKVVARNCAEKRQALSVDQIDENVGINDDGSRRECLRHTGYSAGAKTSPD